jgi:hypothetical protein
VPSYSSLRAVIDADERVIDGIDSGLGGPLDGGIAGRHVTTKGSAVR